MNAENPCIITIPGHVPSLKNSRVLGLSSSGSPFLMKSKAVNLYMKNARASIQRQLAHQFNNEWQPLDTGVAICVKLHVAYSTDYPNSDIDNAYTTIQECTKGIITVDDNQIEHFWTIRQRVFSRKVEFTEIFFWQSQQVNYLSEMEHFIYFLKGYNGRENTSSTAAKIVVPDNLRSNSQAVDRF